MEKVYKIATSIQRYVMGSASGLEREEVEMWLAESSEHQRMLDEFSEEYYLDQQNMEHVLFAKDRAFQRFLKSKRRLDRRKAARWISTVAAMFFVIIGAFSYQMQKNVVPGGEEVIAGVIAPGSSKALLILGTGEKVFLKDSVCFEVSDDRTRIKVEGNYVLYPGDTVTIDSGVDQGHGFNTIETPQGGEYKLVLSDGTRVWLNADTRLRFPVKFSGNSREVYLEGEAYFEVTKDSLHPFRVETGISVIQVLGTSFNVKAYSGEVNRTTLVEGRVLIYSGGHETNIYPDEQWTWNERGGSVVPVSTKVALGWKNGSFAFEEQKLSEVFRELERWYDVQVFSINERVNRMMFTGIFPRYANLDKVLEIVELTTSVRCSVNGRTIVINSE